MPNSLLDQQHRRERIYLELLARLSQLGFSPETALTGITWGQIAETLSLLLDQENRRVADLDNRDLEAGLHAVGRALGDPPAIAWEGMARAILKDLLFPGEVSARGERLESADKERFAWGED